MAHDHFPAVPTAPAAMSAPEGQHQVTGVLSVVPLQPTFEVLCSLCTPSTRSRAFEFFDGSEIGGVFKEVTFLTAMAFNQAYWWTGNVATPIDGPHAERVGRHWMALADPGANNDF